MKNWKQVLAGFSTVALLLTNVGVITPLSVYADEATGTELSSQTLTDGNVTVKGEFPEDAALKATAKSAEDVTVEDNQELIAAYDLEVSYTEVVKDEETGEPVKDEDGNDQTETRTYTLESGKTVTVTIKSDSLKDVEKVNVYLGDEKTSDVKVEDGAVSVTSSLDKTIVVTKDKAEDETPKPQNGDIVIGSSALKSSTEDGKTSVEVSGAPETAKSVKVEKAANPTIEDRTVLAAYDISLVDEDSAKVEPASGSSVTVTLTAEELSGKTTVDIYHYADNATTSDWNQTNVTVSEGKVTFTTDHFSRFAFVDPETGEETTVDLKSIKIQDQIEEDGTFVATFYSDDDCTTDITSTVLQAVKDGTLTIKWNDGSADKDPQNENKPNVINIADDKGAGKTYTVKVMSGDTVLATSDGLKVAYSDQIQNGGFEAVVISGGYEQKRNGTEGLVWQTTASDGKVELGRYEGNSHGAQNDKYNIGSENVGDQYAELNSEQAGALYQDVLTNSDASLTWSLLHRASLWNKTSATDNMYVVIMSTKDAEAAMDGVSKNDQQQMFTTMLQDVISRAGNGKTTTYTLQQGNKKDAVVTVTAWKVSTYSQNNPGKGNKGETDGIDGVYSETSGWAKYTGEYTVPENQFLTRFFFVSGNANSPKTGNLLDNVQFQQGIRAKVEYWVYNTESKKYELKDQESSEAAVGDTITANKTSNYSDYTLQGTTLGKTTGGSDPALTTKTATSFTASSANRVLSLYYSDASKVSGIITWVDGDDKDGDRTDIVVELLDEDGNPVLDENDQPITTTVSADGDGTYSFNNLDKSKRYKTRLKTVTGNYIAETDPDNENNYTLTKTKKVEGTLTWVDGNNADGTRPETVTVKVTGSDGKVHELEVKVPADGSELTYSFDDLPKYDADGNEITYTLTSVVTPDGSEYKVSLDENGTDATLKRSAMRKVAGKLTWADNNDADGIRPDDVTVDVYDSDGNKVGTAKVTADEDGNWTYSVDDLPKYDEDGNAIDYTIKVSTVNGYETEVNGTDAVLTHGSVTAVAGKITWDDQDNKDGIRPDDVTITVYDGDGNKVGTAKVTVDEDGNWSYELVDLPRFDENGKEIEYTVKVGTVNGYEADVDGTSVTLTHKVKTDSKQSDSKKSHSGGGYAAVDFYLVDDATSKPIPGAQVGLYTSAGELVGVYTTDANGHVAFPNLKGGNYYFQQLTAPAGYNLNATKLNFSLDGTPLALMLSDTQAGAAAGNNAAAVTPDGTAANGAVTAAGQGAGAENGAAVGGATGDSSNMMLYGASAGAAAILLAVWFVMNRKRANG